MRSSAAVGVNTGEAWRKHGLFCPSHARAMLQGCPAAQLSLAVCGPTPPLGLKWR